jgi:tetratricopeptide (TPR) repeat protein
MQIDVENPVVKLCGAGMQAELEGRPEEARKLFEEAWSMSRDDYEACLAAHYLARHQHTPEKAFEWNRMALARADAVADERVAEFYPSLLLNMGHSYELRGDNAEARDHYQRAAERLTVLPEGPYKQIVETGVAGGLKRTEPEQ